MIVMCFPSRTATASESDIVSGADRAVSQTDIDTSSPWYVSEAVALAALLVDDTNDMVLYEKYAHEQINPASTTKIMTALLIVEAIEAGKISLEDKITATIPQLNSVMWDASHISPRVKIDETMTVESYLYSVMIESDCVCCNILAEHLCGSVNEFVKLMNKRAEELGCEKTSFVNAHGYPAEGHKTTAWSLYLIAREAMKHPIFARICGTNTYTLPATDKYKERRLKNTNWLLGMPSSTDIPYDTDYTFDGCLGIKTGYSSEAGSCLVSCAERDGRTLFCVITGAWANKLADGTTQRRSFSESVRLLDWGYSNFSRHCYIEQSDVVGSCPVSGAYHTDSVPLVPSENGWGFLPNAADYTDLDCAVTLNSECVPTPIKKGDVLGCMTLSHNGTQIAQLTLSAARSVNSANKLQLLMLKLESTDTRPQRIGVQLALLVLIVLIIMAQVRARKKRGTKAQERRTAPYMNNRSCNDYRR